MKLPSSSAWIQLDRRLWPKFAILMLYVAVTWSATLVHAMWRDEIQAWLIARDSRDLSELFHNLHYEGHAALWYLLLMPLARLSRDPFLMQLLHLTIATVTVTMVLWRAPLSRLEQALFPFGYFFLYEYAIKSRSYALGCLFVFLLCAVWRWRRQSPVVVALVLALMANVGILFMILSMAAVLALAADRFTGNPPSGEDPPAGWRSELMAVAIVCAGWTLAVATVVPPPDSGYAVGWLFGWSLPQAKMTFAALCVLFTPLPSIVACVSTVVILLIAASRSRESPPAAIFLAASVLGLLTFFYVKYPGGTWHHGLIFIAVFAAVWIDRIDRMAQGSAARSRGKQLVPAMLFGAILAFQAYGGVSAVWTDLHHPLSRGRDVARFIAAQSWAADPIIGFPDSTSATIVGYLGVKQVYFPQGRRWGSFTIWDQRRTGPVNFDQALTEMGHSGSAATWIAALQADNPDLMRKYGFVEVVKFSGAAIENYIVYRRPAGMKP